MRSKKSCFNGTVIKKDLLHFMPAWILYFCFLLAVLGAQFVNLLTITERYGYSAEYIPFARVSTTIWILQSLYLPQIFAVFGCLFALLMFYYLHFSRSANMIHAYPLRRETLFFSHAWSGFLMTAIPAVVAGLLMTVFVAGVDTRLIGPALYWVLYSVVCSLLFFSLAVVLCMITGVIFVVPVLFVILNYLVDGIRYLILSFVAQVNYGLGPAADNVGITGIWAPLGHLSEEVGFDIGFSEEVDVSRVLWENGITYRGGWSLLIYTVVAVVLLLIALLLYRKRRIEDVGKIITVKPLRPVFQWGVTFCGALLLSVFAAGELPLSPKNTFPVLLLLFLGFSAVIFYLVEVITTRRWRSMNRKKWAELACFAVTFSLLGALTEADAFGVEKRLPDTDQVILVEGYIGRSLVSSEQMDIERVRALQEELIAEKDLIESIQNKEEYSYAEYVNMTYYGENGREMRRSYEIPYSEETEGVSSVVMLQSIVDDERLFMRENFCVNYEDIRLRGGGIDLYDDTFPDGEESYFLLEFDEEEAQELFSAYMEDFREGNLSVDFAVSSGAENNLQQTYYDDLRLDFYVPGGRPIDQYEELWKLEQNDPEPYITETFEGVGGDYQNTRSVYLSIPTTASHTIETMERLGFFEGGYGLVLYPDSWY